MDFVSGEITSLKTGYMTAYNVIETIEFVSASFFISSIVILNTSTTTWEEMLTGTGGSGKGKQFKEHS